MLCIRLVFGDTDTPKTTLLKQELVGPELRRFCHAFLRGHHAQAKDVWLRVMSPAETSSKTGSHLAVVPLFKVELWVTQACATPTLPCSLGGFKGNLSLGCLFFCPGAAHTRYLSRRPFSFFHPGCVWFHLDSLKGAGWLASWLLGCLVGWLAYWDLGAVG